MFSKDITFEDFNGVPRSERFYFNMMVPEIADLNFDARVGKDLSSFMKDTVKSNDGERIYTFFKLLVICSYGRRSEDGAAFRKKSEWTEDFLASKAWEQLFLWLSDPNQGDKNLGAFWTGIFPPELMARAEALEGINNTGKPVEELSKEELLELMRQQQQKLAASTS